MLPITPEERGVLQAEREALQAELDPKIYRLLELAWLVDGTPPGMVALDKLFKKTSKARQILQ